MNDFTKGELFYIASLFSQLNFGDSELYYKIDDMIRNYSELEDINYYHCKQCKENLAMDLECPACGESTQDLINHPNVAEK